MDGPGFHVDISALERASDSIVRTVDEQKRSQLEDVGRGAEVYGDEGLHGTGRWTARRPLG